MLSAVENSSIDAGLLRSLMTEDAFCPAEPVSLEQAGISETLVEGLLCKQLAVSGSLTGRALAREVW
jgi:hypothetical protein